MHEDDRNKGITIVASHAQGLGLELARYFLNEDQSVCIAHQNPQKGELDRRTLLQHQVQAQVEYERLDLSDLESVQRFAYQCYQRGRPIQQLGIALESAKKEWSDDAKNKFEDKFTAFLIGPFFLAVKLAPLLLPGAQIYLLSPNLKSSAQKIKAEDFFKSNYSPEQIKKVASQNLKLFLIELERVCDESGKAIQLLSSDASELSDTHNFMPVESTERAPDWLMDYVLRFGSETQGQWKEYNKRGNSYGQRKNSLSHQTPY